MKIQISIIIPWLATLFIVHLLHTFVLPFFIPYVHIASLVEIILAFVIGFLGSRYFMYLYCKKQTRDRQD